MGIVNEYWEGVLQRLRAEVEIFAELVAHNAEKGRENEAAFARILEEFVPSRYGVGTGLLIDRHGNVSRQLDIIIFDQADEPAVLAQTNQLLFPVESVHAVIEVKTRVTTKEIADCAKKAASVAALKPVTGHTHPIVALMGYQTEVAHATTASSFKAHSDEERIDLGLILETGMLLGSDETFWRGTSSVFEVGYALVPEGAGEVRIEGKDAPPNMRLLHGGATYPVTKIGTDFMLVDSARALLLFVETLARLMATNRGDREPVVSHYLSGETRRVRVVDESD